MITVMHTSAVRYVAQHSEVCGVEAAGVLIECSAWANTVWDTIHLIYLKPHPHTHAHKHPPYKRDFRRSDSTATRQQLPLPYVDHAAGVREGLVNCIPGGWHEMNLTG